MICKWRISLAPRLLAAFAVAAMISSAYAGQTASKPRRQRSATLPRAHYVSDVQSFAATARGRRQPQQNTAPAHSVANAILSIVKRRGNSGASGNPSAVPQPGRLVTPQQPPQPPRRPDFKNPTLPPRPPRRPDLKNPTLPPRPPQRPDHPTPPGQPPHPQPPRPNPPGNPADLHVPPAIVQQPRGSEHGTILNVRPRIKPTGPDGKFTPQDKQAIRDAFVADLKSGKLAGLTNSTIGKQLKLAEQFQMAAKGDLGLQLHLLKQKGQWQAPLVKGLLAPGFHKNGVSYCYAGPGIFPQYCLLPPLGGWYNWCWNCCCHPVLPPWGTWIWWPCLDWHPLHHCCCGAWNCPPVVIHEGMDLQLLAVRHVDSGHPEQKLGQRVRLEIRNNSPADMFKNFNVMVFATNTPKLLHGNVPHAGVRIKHMAAGEVRTLDLRLPFEANQMSLDAEGHPAPYKYLHAIVDADREVVEVYERNNGAVIPRVELLPVDPLAFAADMQEAPAGAELSIAAEGIGPVPGQALVFVNGLELQAEIIGWTELGVRVRLPNLPVVAPTPIQIVLVRADGAAAPPLPGTLLPAVQ